MDKDWRIDGMEKHFSYLNGRQFERTEFQPTEGWDHEHCLFCWEKLNGPGSQWYRAESGKDWICPVCFEDFRGRFGWTVCPEKSE